jgi:hypothetical protein
LIRILCEPLIHPFLYKVINNYLIACSLLTSSRMPDVTARVMHHSLPVVAQDRTIGWGGDGLPSPMTDIYCYTAAAV